MMTTFTAHLNTMTTEELIFRLSELEMVIASPEVADDAQAYDAACEEHISILDLLDAADAPGQFCYLFSEDAEWRQLPELTICGVRYAPFHGVRIPAEAARRRRQLGTWSERASTPGYYITYARADGIALRALGR